MGGCSAVNCTSHSRKGIRMVGFPSNKERRKQWLINCGRGNWEPGRGAQLCIVHFEESQFELKRQDNWKKLKQDAIPTIFNISVKAVKGVKVKKVVKDNAGDQSSSFARKDKRIKEEKDEVLNEEVDFSFPSKNHTYTKFSDKQGTSWLLLHNSPNIVENQSNNATVEDNNLKEAMEFCAVHDIKQEFPIEIKQELVEFDCNAQTEISNKIFVAEFPNEVKQELVEFECNAETGISDNTVVAHTVLRAQKNLPRKKCRPQRNIVIDADAEAVQDPKDFWCQICFRFLTRKSEFDRHLRLHDSSRIYKCQKCSKLFSALGLHQHLQNYVCKKCGKCFNTRALLDQHLFVDEGIRNYVCKICGKSYFLKEYLTKHLKKHATLQNQNAKMYSCETCEKRFSCRLSLRQHFLTHEGIKRYICEICGKGFVHKSSLIKHKFFHTGIKNYACKICDKRFALLRTYNNHLLIHEGSRNFMCDKCGKAFVRKDHLNTHIASHTGIKNYACKICDKRFAWLKTYNNHLLIHEGSRNFMCDKCGKAFARKDNLNTHIASHNKFKQ